MFIVVGKVSVFLIGCLIVITSSHVARSQQIGGGNVGGEVCSYALEFFFLQDISMSYDNDLPHLRSELPTFLRKLRDKYHNSRFALATFSDYPFVDVGFKAFKPRDYCFRLESGFTTDYEKIEFALNRLRLVSGRDWPESSLVALHHAAIGGYFSDVGEGDVSGSTPYVRVIVLSTDAPPHRAGDLKRELAKHVQYWNHDADKFLFGDVPTDKMPVYTVKQNNGDEVMECGQDPESLEFEDYVTMDQVGQALVASNALVVFMATEDVKSTWDDISAELQEKYGIKSVVAGLRDDSADLMESLTGALDEIQEFVCQTTPTPPVTHTGPEVCPDEAALDLFLTQDITASYKNDLPNLKQKIPEIYELVNKDFYKTRFGLSTFGDKPTRPLGSPKSRDYCYALTVPLGEGNEMYVAAAMNHLKTRSGLDWKECQLEALIGATKQSETGWRVEDVVDGYPVLRVIALATDAGYHIAGDGYKHGLVVPNPGTGYMDQAVHDYPTVSQTVAVLREAKVFPLFLVTKDVVPIYEKLVSEIESHGGFGAVAALTDDSADILEAIKSGLKQLCERTATHRRRMLQEWMEAKM